MVIEIKIDSRKCKGCELCIWVCKRDVIKISEKFNKMGYRFAEVVNEENCTGCANCAIICPDVCIEIMKGENNARDNVKKRAQYLNKRVRRHSTRTPR